MFTCKHCKTLQDALAFERERTERLINQIMALTKPEALSAVHYAEQSSNSSDYYGGEGDEVIGYDDFGEQILTKKKDERTLRQ